MSLGVAVFASVVLILAVYHKGFRKVVLWAAVITVILALLGAGGYFAYDRYTVGQQEKAHKQAVKDCVARFPRADIFDEAACDENPTIVPPGATVAPDYTIVQNNDASDRPRMPDQAYTTVRLKDGTVLRIKGANLTPEQVAQGVAKFQAAQIQAQSRTDGTTSANAAKKLPTITATVTCDVVVYDRDKFGAGDPQAIDSLHEGDTVQYVGHVTVGDQDIIRVHGRKGYVDSCVEVKP